MAHTKKSSQSGSGAPTTVTPEFVGQVYHDTTNGNSYVANGTGSGDWDQLVDETHSHELNDLSDVSVTSPEVRDVLSYNGSSNSWLETPGKITNAAMFSNYKDITTYGGASESTDEGVIQRPVFREEYNNISGCELISHAITGVNTTSKTFTVSGDVQSDFDVGAWFVVRGSTGNDRPSQGVDENRPYLISNISLDGYSDTVITTSDNIPDSTVDGTIYTGRILIPAGTYMLDILAQSHQHYNTQIRFSSVDNATYSNAYISSEGSTYTHFGPIGYAYNYGYVQSKMLETIISPSSSKQWEVQQLARTTWRAIYSSFGMYPASLFVQLIKI